MKFSSSNFLPDIFVCIDTDTLETVDISEKLPIYQSKFVDANEITANKPNHIVLALVAGSTSDFRNLDGVRCGDQPIGYLKEKCRQLEICGFHPVLVSMRIFFYFR